MPLRNFDMQQIDFDQVTPDEFNQWLNQSVNAFRFRQLMPLAERNAKADRNSDAGRAVFGLYANGVKTNRDEWVYDFDSKNLKAKATFFAKTYNGFLDANDQSFNPIIKWSRDLRNEFQRGRFIEYSDKCAITSLYRPYTLKHHYVDFTMNDVLTRKHCEMFGPELRQPNKVICFSGIASSKPFQVLVTDKLPGFDMLENTQCLPLYRYTDNGERLCNITEWAIREFNDHARALWGDHFAEAAGSDGITAEDIFAYTYAVLHDPVYRVDYREELKQGFPRLPFYRDFEHWVKMGRMLLELHLDYQGAEPYPLERVDSPSTGSGRAVRVILRADKERGTIVVDEETTLRGVPEFAWEYQLGSRTALEWVLAQYKERKPRDATISERFNTYNFADYKERVIDLLQRVCTVSFKTAEIVGGMAYWDDGNLVVWDDRDEYEWVPTRVQHQWHYGEVSKKQAGEWSAT